MKNLKASIREWVLAMELRWKSLPLKRQQHYTLVLFIAYALITVIILCYEGSEVMKPGNEIKIDHIKVPEVPKSKSPASLQDTVSIIIKNKVYERI